jgi:hypothetical protein
MIIFTIEFNSFQFHFKKLKKRFVTNNEWNIYLDK